MTISEMHVWFRQYAQQMGMQNVRAILPEQIDNLINTSTLDVIDEIINRNVGTTNDRVITDNAKLANINALRTLYKVKTIDNINVSVSAYKNEPYTFTSESIDSALYFVDFSVKYKRGSDNYTRWFPVRVIDDSYLADVLNDWVLAPRLRTPVMVIYKGISEAETSLDSIIASSRNSYYEALSNYEAAQRAGADARTLAGLQAIVDSTLENYNAALNNRSQFIDSDLHTSTFEVYFGENDSIQTIMSDIKLGKIRCSYIKKPVKVAYLTDISGENVNSDLPEQLQIPMLKHAVDLYRVSIQGSLYANQQNAQQNQQELVRNNARPDNDGYQS